MAQRIVIIDDSALNRRILESLVAQLHDVEVMSFAGSADALARAPSLEASLFIVDYRMPSPDGMAVLRAIRADGRIGQTPVVMITAAEEREVCYAALEHGASDFLVRPIDPREFTRRIGNLLALEAARSDAAANLSHHATAARINGLRLDLIWRAGMSTADDDTFVQTLIDDASRAIIEGQHLAGVLAKRDGDDFEITIANDAAQRGGEGVGHRVPIAPHRAAVDAEAIEAVADLPVQRRGAPGWRTSIFAPFRVDDAEYFVGFLALEPKATPFDAFDRSFIETIANLCATRLRQRAAFARLRFHAEHDAMTGLLNRASFRALGLATMRDSKSVGLLVLNVDDFHRANDTLGQHIGDALLVEVAARLNDAAEQDETVARLGGDTFGVLIEHCYGREQATASANRFLATFRYPFLTDRVGRDHVSLAATVGIASAPHDADGFEMLLARGDTACMQAKNSGRGRYAFFDLAAEESLVQTRMLESDLKTALAKNEFVLYFQPHVDLATRRIIGAEALIRWHHPKRGFLGPGAFIPFAERHGLAGAIGAWVMRETARASHQWRREDPTFRAWFNLSASEMRDATLVTRLRDIDVDLSGLGVEITESVAMQNVVETRSVMTALQDAGVRVALDDFGTGYSSLAQLKRLPIDVIKIDRAFVTGLPHDRYDAAIVKAVLSIANTLGFETLAEGIESEEQSAFLCRIGCTLGQGYLYGHPMPSDEFTALIYATRSAHPELSRDRHAASKHT